MSGRFAPLHQAMQILGARSVTVFSVSSGSEVWSKTGTTVTSGTTVRMTGTTLTTTGTAITIDADLVAAMAGMVAAARRLATVADPDGPLDEVLALDEVWFHVLFPLDSQETGPQVAYLLLERNVANLAAARREFRSLVQAVPAIQHASAPSSEAAKTEAATAAAEEAEAEAATTGTATTPVAAPKAAGRPAFPRRVAAIPIEPGALPEDGTFGEHTRWLNQAAGPFVSDEWTLRRLLEALRQL